MSFGRDPTVTTGELAAALHYTQKSLPRLIARGILPRPNTSGEFRIVELLEAFGRVLKRRTSLGSDGVDGESVEEAKARFERAKADAQEIEVAQALEELVPRREYLAESERANAGLRSRLDAIPNRLAPELEGRDAITIAERIRAEIAQALSDHVEALEVDVAADSPEASGERGEDPAVPAESDGERVGEQVPPSEP